MTVVKSTEAQMEDKSSQHGLLLRFGVLFGSLTFLLFAGLVVASLFHYSVPTDSRYLIPIALATGAGLSAAAFGGSAAVSGSLAVPLLGRNPVTISLTGGGAVFVIVLLLGRSIVAIGPDVPPVMLSRVTAAVLNTAPSRLLVTARFPPLSLGTEYKMFLMVGSDATCAQPVIEGLVDDPGLGQMRLFISAPREQVSCARIVLKDAHGQQLGASDVQTVIW